MKQLLVNNNTTNSSFVYIKSKIMLLIFLWVIFTLIKRRVIGYFVLYTAGKIGKNIVMLKF